MQGRDVSAAWDVRYLAAATSIETGIGIVLLYAMIRRVLPTSSSVIRGVLLGLLLLAIMGRLLRQPVLDLVVGNPIEVVAIQDGVSWVVWLSACIVAALVYDRLQPLPRTS